MGRPTLVMGNWKMNLSIEAARRLARDLVAGAPSVPDGAVVLIPSPLHVESVARIVEGTRLELGAQDCVAQGPGAFTGGTSVAQLAEVGTAWVLVGHSERRAVFGEADDLLAAKFAAVLAGGLRPVLCVGETLEERESGRTKERIRAQVEAVLGTRPDGEFAIAYEPVWAIGTGRNAVLADVVEVHGYIRELLAGTGGLDFADSTPILYGGSVNESNAAEYLSDPGIDGALVGGASLDAAKFGRICAAAAGEAI